MNIGITAAIRADLATHSFCFRCIALEIDEPVYTMMAETAVVPAVLPPVNRAG
jgi:hypothetical protein